MKKSNVQPLHKAQTTLSTFFSKPSLSKLQSKKNNSNRDTEYAASNHLESDKANSKQIFSKNNFLKTNDSNPKNVSNAKLNISQCSDKIKQSSFTTSSTVKPDIDLNGLSDSRNGIDKHILDIKRKLSDDIENIISPSKKTKTINLNLSPLLEKNLNKSQEFDISSNNITKDKIFNGKNQHLLDLEKTEHINSHSLLSLSPVKNESCETNSKKMNISEDSFFDDCDDEELSMIEIDEHFNSSTNNSANSSKTAMNLNKNDFPSDKIVSSENTFIDDSDDDDFSNINMDEAHLKLLSIEFEKLSKTESNLKPDESPADNINHSCDSFNDVFDDIDFNNVDMEEEDLDLCQWQKCEVIHIDSCFTLKLRSMNNHRKGSCILKDFWRDSNLEVGNIVSIIAIKTANDQQYQISNAGGFLVIWPDNLLTSVEIVGSLFCMRKSILQSSFRGIDSSNKNMVIGTLVHELLQLCLSKGYYTIADVTLECTEMLKNLQYISMIYDADMTDADTLLEMKKFIPNIALFIYKYVKLPNKKPFLAPKEQNKSAFKGQNNFKKSEWKGSIHNVVDIEENIWSPKLGISGRIDVSVEVTIHDENTRQFHRSIMPLELKTGRPSNSPEHRGQVILYTLIMSEMEKENVKLKDVNHGLLLYLKESVEIQQISANYAEKRDLIILRNQLAYYIEKWQNSFINKIDTSQKSAESFDSNQTNSINKNIILPNPINHHSACSTCPYLTICSLYLSKDSSVKLPDNHLLTTLKKEAIGHLVPDDFDYFLHWCNLINEEGSQKVDSIQRKDIWNMMPLDREKRGKCLSNMIISTIISKDDKFDHTFIRNASQLTLNTLSDLRQSLLLPGGYVVISTEYEYAQAAGFITNIDDKTVVISLDRDLSKKNLKSTVYNLDSYDSQSSVNYNLTNIGILMDNTEMSRKLRRIIIGKQKSTFVEKLSSSIIEKGRKILNRLNHIQQRAVLKALAAEDYILIKGMPGTGKTQTLVALVELLVELNKSVLITSHTHSAVDTVLLRLKDRKLKMLRIGSEGRVHPDLQAYTERSLIEHCKSSIELQEVYNNINIVGVTCLGSNHPLISKKMFDVCIVDESTQVLQCTVLRPLFAAKKFVLVGDPDQLPPIVKSNKARSLGMDESLFSRLDGLGSTVSLTLQYRMNNTIMTLANRLTYNGQLACGNENVSNSTLHFKCHDSSTGNMNDAWLTRCLSQSLKDSVTFIDTGNTHSLCKQFEFTDNIKNQEESKYTNICESALILHIISELLKNGVSEKQIGIIAPYRNQVLFLKKIVKKYAMDKDIDSHSKSTDEYLNIIDDLNPSISNLNEIEINTVDQYQGRDKEIIIYSCTKSWMNKQTCQISTENQLLEDKRRLTVAITRAKYKLIIIGDVSSLISYKPFRELFHIASNNEGLGDYISLPEMEANKSFSWNKIMHIFERISACWSMVNIVTRAYTRGYPGNNANFTRLEQ